MDLAISLALNEPCRCRDYSAAIVDGGDDGGESVCESCIAVTILLPSSIAENGETFPLLCQRNSTTLHDDSLVATTTSSQVRAPPQNHYQPDATQRRALHRIQVRHVSGLEDVMQYLLSLAGLPVEQQPVGGILVDGLDRLVQQQYPEGAPAATIAIRMSQIGTCCS
jgi:hypothetical protein